MPQRTTTSIARNDLFFSPSNGLLVDELNRGHRLRL
jgi:hypothetical protein